MKERTTGKERGRVKFAARTRGLGLGFWNGGECGHRRGIRVFWEAEGTKEERERNLEERVGMGTKYK